MPRDGSGIYTKPYPSVVSGTTIESLVYNGQVDDVTADLNTARPIVSGGTGANNATAARFNLAAEMATQVVTSYDSHVWVPGSFRSAVGAAGAPNATSKFAGVCYIGEALANPPTNQNVVVEARDLDSVVKPGLLYTRQKTAGVWSGWNSTGTGDDQAAARQAIYAAPLDALAYNGMQINGAMTVSQELGAVETTSTNIIDGWWQFKVGTSTVVAGSSTAIGGYPAGFTNMLYARTDVAQPSLGAGDMYIISQHIEGYRVQRLGWGTAAASPITIGFWSRHVRTGTYSVAVRNPPAYTRSYVASYTHNVSGVAQYNVITIPGCTDGAWHMTNSSGLLLSFPSAAGSSLVASSANTWVTGSFVAAPGQVNGVGATSDLFVITGFVVLPGTEAPSAARSALIMRPADQELLTCQRYFQTLQMDFTGYSTIAGQYFANFVPFSFPMRAAPTFTIATAGTLTNVTTAQWDSATARGSRVVVQSTGTGATAATGRICNAEARL